MAQKQDRPKRIFDPMIPLAVRNGTRPDTEDTELTEFLMWKIGDLYSLSETPPRCPRCNGSQTQLSSRPQNPKPNIPVFICHACNRHFRRTTGTPLAGCRMIGKPEFLKLLSQQRTYAEAARTVGSTALSVTNWTRRIRAWLLDIDPSGYWEARVRLGMQIQPDIAYPHCDG